MVYKCVVIHTLYNIHMHQYSHVVFDDVSIAFLGKGAQSAKQHAPAKHLGVEVLGKAFSSTHGVAVVWFIVCMSYVSALMMGFSMVYLAYTPDFSMYRSDGLLCFISDGFLKNSVTASVVYGLGTTFIGAMRIIATVLYTETASFSVFFVFILIFTVVGGIGTTRYDELQKYHIIAAAVWITSSLIFHGGISAWNKEFTKVNGAPLARITWILNIAAATVFLYHIVLFENNRLEYTWFIAGICEYITCELILIMDVILAFSIQQRYLQYQHVD
jgi:hypothetical protein